MERDRLWSTTNTFLLLCTGGFWTLVRKSLTSSSSRCFRWPTTSRRKISSSTSIFAAWGSTKKWRLSTFCRSSWSTLRGRWTILNRSRSRSAFSSEISDGAMTRTLKLQHRIPKDSALIQLCCLKGHFWKTIETPGKRGPKTIQQKKSKKSYWVKR